MQRQFRKAAFAFLVLLLASAGVAVISKRATGQAQGPYAKNFIWDYQMPKMTPEQEAKRKEERLKQQTTVESTRLLNMNPSRIEGAPYMDFVWLWKGNAKGYNEKQHYHDFDEFIGFIGTKGGQKDPHDLGGEMEVWLGGEKYSITKDCLIYIPKGMNHCPIRFVRIDAPILFFSGAPGSSVPYKPIMTEFKTDKAAERNYAKYISYDVDYNKISPEAQKRSAEAKKKRSSTIEAIRLLDADNVEGAPYLDFVWLWKGTEKGPNHPEHRHEWAEIFGFIGAGSQQDPYNLGSEIELYVGGVKNVITRSCLIYVPPNVAHCPMQFNRIDRPVLTFTIGATPKYTLKVSEIQPK